MRKKIKRTALLLGGMLFIVLGIAGLVLPFLQGFLFLAVGFILLSLLSPTIREFMDKHTVRYPKLHKLVKDTEGWLVSKIGEV